MKWRDFEDTPFTTTCILHTVCEVSQYPFHKVDIQACSFPIEALWDTESNALVKSKKKKKKNTAAACIPDSSSSSQSFVDVCIVNFKNRILTDSLTVGKQIANELLPWMGLFKILLATR